MIKKSSLIFVVFLFLLQLVYAIEPQDPRINLTLGKFQYNQLESILGNITFEFVAPSENHYIKADVGDVHTQIKLADALRRLNLSVMHTPPVQDLYGDLREGIIFPPSPQIIGFKAQKNSRDIQVDSSVMIFGLENLGLYPKFPYIDLRADGTKEWMLLGNLSGWETTFKDSGFLNENEAGRNVRVQNNNTYYCEIINLGKDVSRVNISVKYRLAPNIGASIAVRALGADRLTEMNFMGNGLPEEECVLPQITDQNSQWTGCELEFRIPRIRNSEVMFCVYAKTNFTSGEDIFFLDIDNSGTGSYSQSRTAECRYAGGGFNCIKQRGWNYFVKINLPIYDGIFRQGIIFSQGLLVTSSSFAVKIRNYLENCNPDLENNCVVLFEVGSQSGGIISLPDNLIRIQGVGTVFGKYREKSEIITNISGRDLSRGFNISIPLGVMDNLTTPRTQYVQLLPLSIKFGSRNILNDIEVGGIVAIGGEELNVTIERVLASINRYLSDSSLVPILDFTQLDLGSKKSSLLSYRAALAAIEGNTTMDASNKTAEKQRIKNQVIGLVSDIPQDMFIVNEVSNFPVIPPDQVLELYLPIDKRSDDIKESILGLQSKVEINSRAIAYKLKTAQGEIQERTLIIRDVSTSLANPYLVEDIPATLAGNNEIEFKQPATLLREGNRLKLELRLGSGKLIYQLKGNVISKLSDIRTLVISTEGISAQPEGFHEARCGDGICTIPVEDRIVCPEDCKRKIPWTTIVIILFVFFVLAYYINFYKGQYSFRSLLQKERLFKTEADKINLINYIEKASKHISIDKVTSLLISQGWTKEQIYYVLKKLNKEKKR